MLLRTKPEGRCAEISEPVATLDKTRGKHRGNVRTWDTFGQNKGEELQKCPNPGPLRTKQRGRAAEMCEPGVTSDKTRGKIRRNVRTRGYFVQNHRVESLKCPNLGILQTKPEGRVAGMSELVATSVKTRRKSSGNIRTS